MTERRQNVCVCHRRRDTSLPTAHIDWNQVWSCLYKGSQFYPDECHFNPSWVSFLPVCNEPQWGWTPCSPVPLPVSTNEPLNKSVLVPSPTPPIPWSIHYHFFSSLILPRLSPVTLPCHPIPIMSTSEYLTSPANIVCLLIVSICLWDNLPFPCSKIVWYTNLFMSDC